MEGPDEIRERRLAAAAEIRGIELQRDRELLVRLAALEAEQKRRRAEERIRYYNPHMKQRAFHTADKTHRIRLILGGNRSGKSECSMAEAVAHSIGYRPWLAKDDPDYWVWHKIRGERMRVPNRGLIVGESFSEQVKKVLVHKLLGSRDEGGLIPKPFVKSTKKNQIGVITEIHLSNGSSIYFKSYEQDVKLFESENYDWYALDEPPPREHYVAISRGATDTGAPVWMALTPLSQAWIHDELCSRSDVFKIHYDMKDNIGFGLSEEAVAEFEKDLTEDEKEMRLHGRFFHLQGLVYKEFDRAHHLLKRPDRKWPRDSWRYWMHVDPHVRKRHKAVWIAIRPDDTYLVIGELQTPPNTNLISHFAEMIKSYERSVLGIPADDIERLIDPLSTEPGVTETGLSIKQEFERYGLYFQLGSKKRDTAMHFMHELLRCRPEEGVFPRFYVLDDLPQTIYEFEHYQYEEWRGRDVQDRKDPNPKPRKKHDDFIEGIHRIVLATYVPEADDEDYRHGYNPPHKVGFQTGY